MGIPGREIIRGSYDRSIGERSDCGKLTHKLSMVLLATAAIDHPIAHEDYQ